MSKRYTMLNYALMLLLSVAIAAAQGQTFQKVQLDKTLNTPQMIHVKKQMHKSDFFKEVKAAYRLNKNDDFQEAREKSDELGFKHTMYKQFHKGVEILGAEYILHEKDGGVVSANGRMVANMDLDVSPQLSKNAAFSRALATVDGKGYMWESHPADYQMPEGKLVITSKGYKMEEHLLAYRYEINIEYPRARYFIDVDAKSGEIINKYNGIHTSDVAASGTSLYNGTVNFTADYTGSNYRLRQAADGNGIQTFNMNNGTNYNSATDFTSSSTSFTSDATGVQAHWGAEQTHKYFMQKHSRNSYNGSGAIIKSYVHYSSNYVNAFWDGQRMTYGDGDGTNYSPLVCLDIVGHEVTHGVTEYTAGLVYSYESGALNESFSDIFGESIEHFAKGSNDWQMGTEIGIGGSGAIRSMDNPNAHGDPDTYGGTNWYSGSGDNGGVHTNSGVQNKWFYILTEGESGTNDNGDSYSVSGIGIDKAGAIAYRNLSVYLTSNSNYAAARTGAISAARDLYGAGSAEEIATTNAWHAVGVGDPWVDNNDTTPPTISSVGSSVNGTSATVTWSTNEGATSRVEYGTTTSYGSTTTETSSYVTSHSVTLASLSANTTYNYRVHSKDAAGNASVSSNGTFTTGDTPSGGDIEPNNSFAQAVAIDANSSFSGYINTNGDEDYFVFSTSGAGALHVEIKNFPGDYDIFLYNGSQSELARGYTTADPEVIDYSVTGAGTYYVRVDGYTSSYSATDDYEFSITFTPEAVGTWYYENVSFESKHNYSNYTNDTKSYTKTGASKVAVYFERFETEANYDYVYIKDKNNVTKDTFHGTLAAFWAIVDGDKINVNLVTDYSVRKWGYKVSQVAYYSSAPLANGIASFNGKREHTALAGSYVHINGSKGAAVNAFDVKEQVSDGLPEGFQLDGAYPNPFNPITNIRFFLADQMDVKVEILNVLGQTVKTLVNGNLEGGQHHELTWNATNTAGNKVTSGVYFYRVSAGADVQVRKLVLLK